MEPLAHTVQFWIKMDTSQVKLNHFHAKANEKTLKWNWICFKKEYQNLLSPWKIFRIHIIDCLHITNAAHSTRQKFFDLIIVGSVVECSSSTRAVQVRFPVNTPLISIATNTAIDTLGRSTDIVQMQRGFLFNYSNLKLSNSAEMLENDNAVRVF